MSSLPPLAASSVLPRPRQSSSLKARAMHKSFLARSSQRSSSTTAISHEMALPERFRTGPGGDGEDDGDDGVGDADSPLSAQSVYGMLAATQSPATFPSGLQRGSLSEEDEEDGSEQRLKTVLSQSIAAMPPRQRTNFEAWRERRKAAEEGRRSLRPVQEQGLHEGKKSGRRLQEEAGDGMTDSQILVRPDRQEDVPKQAMLQDNTPVLDRKLEAMARSGILTTGGHESDANSDAEKAAAPDTRPLPRVIADIFAFDEPESVVAEYPCWYLQNILLQGYMYITEKHVCFYAYLQKRTSVAEKTGHLRKQGRHSYKYRQYYFVLKGDTFSYYRDASDPYFPLGMVDLRYAISADVTTAQGEESADFTITTADRTYLYRADTPSAAKSWVKALQKAIFRTNNEGDSVKISLPIEDIDEVERMPMVDFAETIKLRVLDRDDTFAVDEYFFTFFGESGPQALEVLQQVTEQWQEKGSVEEEEKSRATRIQPARGRTSLAKGELQSSAEVSPMSGDQTQRSEREKRDVQTVSASAQKSTDSLTTSSEQTQASESDDEMDPNMSASQMLTGDGVFGSPTLRTPHPRRGERLDVPTLNRTTTDQTIRQQQRPTSAGDEDAARRPSTDSTALGRGKLAAISVANVVRSSSKRMGSYLGSSPKGYINKFAEAVIGGSRHYDDAHIPAPDERSKTLDGTHSELAVRQQRFQDHFALAATEKLEATYFCYLHKNLPIYGKIYISKHRFCFRSLIYGVRTKLVIPIQKIVNVEAQRGFRLGYSGIVLVIHGHEELFFEFRTENARNDCAATIFRKLEVPPAGAESMMLTEDQRRIADGAAAENELLRATRKDAPAIKLPQTLDDSDDETVPVLTDDPAASLVDIESPPSMLVTCLTIGSRGDVQPYIALCKGLMAQGHRARIATHAEFRPWVESHGIEFAEVAGDPAELMRVCVENGMFTIPFFLEANSKFRSWLDGLLLTAWEACQGADLIIESPSAMCGIHIAEALGKPYFRAFTMPWTRTRAYPHAFAVRNAKMGGAYNYMTYTLFDNVFWTWTEGQINSWRVKTLGLPPTNLDKLQQNKVPFLYNFSPSVVPPPLDFSDWVKVTGYWFLNEGADYTPPEDLAAFIKKARDDGMKLVYIGFGSVTVNDSRKLTEQIVNAVLKADVRCILSKGWSDRLEAKDATLPELVLPDCIHAIRAAPHDWLFRQVDAVVHHGGAGTTGASLRAGKPTIIKPFFGDQYFFATRVEDLGVGIYLTKATEHQLGKALWTAVHDDRMQTKARLLGEAIRSQDGVATAIKAIYADLEYARMLVQRRRMQAPRLVASATARATGVEGEEEDEKIEILEDTTEENWTFVEKTGRGDEDEFAAEALRTPGLEGQTMTAGHQQNRPMLRTALRLNPIGLVGRRA